MGPQWVSPLQLINHTVESYITGHENPPDVGVNSPSANFVHHRDYNKKEEQRKNSLSWMHRTTSDACPNTTLKRATSVVDRDLSNLSMDLQWCFAVSFCTASPSTNFILPILCINHSCCAIGSVLFKNSLALDSLLTACWLLGVGCKGKMSFSYESFQVDAFVWKLDLRNRRP